MRLAFPGIETDETPYSQAVADHLGLPIFSAYPLDDKDLCRPAPTLPDHLFDPTMRMCIPLLEETARRGIRTTLNGIGGDHLMYFTGLERIHHLRRGNVWDAAIEAGIAEEPLSAKAWWGLVVQGIKAFTPPPVVRAIRRARLRDRRWLWLTPAMCEVLKQHTALAERRAEALHPDPIERQMRDNLAHGVSTPHALAFTDRTVARFGQEARYPFLDVRVVDYLMAIPSTQRFYRRLPKPVLRRAMAGTLPALVRERRDKGDFEAFVRKSFWEPHAGAVRALFRRSMLEEIGVVDGDDVRRSLDAGEPPLFYLIGLTSMELWLRQTMSPAPNAAGFRTEVSEEQHGRV
jgi:asparagine synthetase B (glutamine-hydrolysing)